MRYLVAFGRFWYDFVIGDDWRVAAGAVGVLAVAALIVALGAGGTWLPPLVVVGLITAFSVPLVRDR